MSISLPVTAPHQDVALAELTTNSSQFFTFMAMHQSWAMPIHTHTVSFMPSNSGVGSISHHSSGSGTNGESSEKIKETLVKIMSISKKDLDPAFQGAGQEAGIEIWRIEKFNPVPIPTESKGKFFSGDCYVILKTTALKSGALRHDIHYWLGKDSSQNEAGIAAIKTVELDAVLGGRAVQYREVQGHETEKFLSYFKPCIIPLEGGVASGFKHAKAEEHQARLYECKGKHVVHVKEVPFARSSLNHDDIFILDTESKIFQFNGSNSCIQERAKALEVVQYIKDTYHRGKCEIATIEDGKLMSDAATGEFWGFFGGFAPLPKKTHADESKSDNTTSKLFCVEKGEAVSMEADSLTRELLETNKCYILDCEIEVFIWVGRSTSLEERKAACKAVDELMHTLNRSRTDIVRVIEGHETVIFISKFDSWPQSTNETQSAEGGRGKVTALLKRQGLNVKGLVKTESPRAEPQPYIDCTGGLQVWRVNGQQKTLLEDSNESKFYSGDCYIFQYSYAGQAREEYLIGTWFGKQSMEEDQAGATSQASKTVEEMKFIPAQTRIHDGCEPLLFFAIFQSFIIFKGGLSEGYKNCITEKEVKDETYNEEGLALFRVQGSGPENMQAIQVAPVASSLNSCYSYILHSGSSVFTWFGSLTTPADQELVERQLDIIKPNTPSRFQKEGAETEQFWELLGEKKEYSSQKIARVAESDPHLFCCTLSNGDLKVTEVYNFNQDDLMTEDIFILDCRSDIYVWVGQQVETKNKMNALGVGQKFLELDFLLEKISPHAPLYAVMEGSEPAFFTRFFSWDSTKANMHGNSFQRKLAILTNGTSVLDKQRMRMPVSFRGRAGAQAKPQRSRSVSVFTADRPRVRGKSPAFTAIASKFEATNARNLSTPPPLVGKLYPKSATPDSSNPTSRSEAIAALTAGFEQQRPGRQLLMPRSRKVNHELPRPGSEAIPRGDSGEMVKPKPETIEEDAKEEDAADDDGLPTYPYERLATTSTDPVEDIDMTKRECYLSSEEFKGKFGMSKSAFYKLPKWKQNKLKMTLELF